MASPGPRLTPGAGPLRPMASAARSGLRAGPVWRLQQVPEGGSTRLSAGFTVPEQAVWELAVFPDLGHDPSSDSSPDPDFGACRLSVDFVTDDGILTLADQHGHPVDGSRQCLVANNWNLLRLDLAPLVGRRVHEVRLSCPEGLTGTGWVQPLGPAPAPVEPADVVERVDTRRGSHSANDYSRGNTLPTVGLPHAAHAITPVTDARQRHWLYGWHRDGIAPPLQALSITHCASPWIGDRSSLQLMPWQHDDDLAPHLRQRRFRHDDEQARPHRYRVGLEGGIAAEVTTSAAGGAWRFRFDGPGPHGVLLDQLGPGRVRCRQLPDGRVAFTVWLPPEVGWQSGHLTVKPAAHVHGETLGPARARRARESHLPLWPLLRRLGRADSPLGRMRLRLPRPQAAVLECEGPVVEVRLAMSFLDADHAERSFRRELDGPGFEDLVAHAHDAWADVLERLEVEGGTLDARRSAWSNLARLYSWPSAHHELAEDGDRLLPVHQAPYGSVLRQLVPRGHPVPGALYVNNGYWDTFRTSWPLYSLLTPHHAAGLLDGILQQYRDSGWMSRWAAPGHVDLMPGTSSDQVFADAALAGTLDDELTAYDSALRNASVPSPSPATGRKGIGRARFTGWTDTETPEGLAWSVDGAAGDAAIGLWSQRLAERARQAPAAGSASRPQALVERLDEFEANAAWFANRSLSHELVHDQDVGFYQGRNRDASFRFPPGEFDPRVWGRDFTETDAWGQAFHAPHDGAGLARLLGGEDAMAASLDELLATPHVTRPRFRGGYRSNIQEMNEAEADGIGQLAISNQPAHHIPFMYLCCGRPWKTQWLTRELLDKKFVGSEIGQGYPGDEDNGEMSGYWLCLALGLFPLFPGSGEWAITAPLFERMAFRRDDQTSLEVRATGVEHRYIQSLRVNGEPWQECTIPIGLLRGDVVLDFELGPEASRWAADSRPWSASTPRGEVTTGEVRRWQRDRTRDARLLAPEVPGAERLLDDAGTRPVRLGAGACVVLEWPEPFAPTLVTLTSPEAAALPLRVELRRAGTWTDANLALRDPLWADQTMPHLLPGGPGKLIDGLRLVATGECVLSQLEVH